MESIDGQIRAELEAPELNESLIKDLILDYFTDNYSARDDSMDLERRHVLNRHIRKGPPAPVFDLELFCSLVERVEVGAGGQVSVLLFNGQRIRSTPAEENRNNG